MLVQIPDGEVKFMAEKLRRVAEQSRSRWVAMDPQSEDALAMLDWSVTCEHAADHLEWSIRQEEQRKSA